MTTDSRVRAPERRPHLRRRVALASLVAPALLFLLAFFVYPLGQLLWKSFQPEASNLGGPGGFTFENYVRIFQDRAYFLVLKETLLVAFLSTLISVVAAYPVAYFLTRLPNRSSKILLAVLLFPIFTSILGRLYGFMQILGPIGLLYSTAGTIIGMVDYLVPYLVVILYSGMTRIPKDLTTSARSLGASPRQAFFRVFLPLSKESLIAGSALIFVMGLGTFIAPAILGGTSGVTIPMYIQSQVSMYKWGSASAMGMVLLVMCALLFAVVGKYSSAADVIVPQKGATGSRGFTYRSLGGMTLTLWYALVLIFLVAPVVVVVLASFTSRSYLGMPPGSLSFRWYTEVFNDSSWLHSAWLSLRVALVTTLVTTAAALLAAIGLERATRTWSAIRVVFILPVAIPVVLIGAGLFDVESRLRIIGGVLGISIGHCVLAFPFAFLVISIALQGMHPALEDAARTLGAGPVKAFFRISFPALTPSIGAAAFLVFTLSWDEAVVALMLTATDATLPVKLFAFLQEQLLPSLAAVSTLLIVVVGLVGLATLAAPRAVRAMRARMH